MTDRNVALRALLEAYRPRGNEAEAVAATLDLIGGDGDAMSADQYDPGHVTASAFVVDRSRRKLVLIQHGKLRTWLQPGGHIDDGEDVLAAAIREVREETGIAAVPIEEGVFDVDVHSIPPSGGRPAHWHFDVRFLLEAEGDDLVESDEVLGVRWVTLADVAKFVTDRSVLRVTKKLTERFGE